MKDSSGLRETFGAARAKNLKSQAGTSRPEKWPGGHEALFRLEPETSPTELRSDHKGEQARIASIDQNRAPVEEPTPMMKVLIASATLIALSAPALAQVTTAPPASKPATEDKFMKHDANADGALSLAEVQTADSKVTQADFDQYDADKSKSLSKVEFSKWAEAKTTPPASAPGQ